MKISKKLITIVLTLALVIGTVAAVMVSASAAENTVAYTFDGAKRLYSYGEYPDTVKYTDTGWIQFYGKDFQRQYQVAFFLSEADSDKFEAAVDLALEENGGVLCFDSETIRSKGTIQNDPGYEEDTGFQVELMIWYNYVDGGEEYDDGVIKQTVSWQAQNGVHSYNVDVSDLSLWESYEITSMKVGMMNYACLANPDGQAGLGDAEVRFSPLYVQGYQAPEMGNFVNEEFAQGIDPSLYLWEDPLAPAEGEAYTPDGPFYVEGGTEPWEKGGMLQRDETGEPMLVNPPTTDPTDPEPTDPEPTDPEPTEVMYGDLNNDGKYTATDSMYIRLIVAELDQPSQNINYDAADVNGDEKYTAADTMYIRRLVAELITVDELPVNQ